MDAIEALGYRPNRTAQSLQARKTQRIGYRLRIPDRRLLSMSSLHRLVATASTHGFDLSLFSPRPGQEDLDCVSGGNSEWRRGRVCPI